jgi:hypothetical protein
MEAQMQVMSLDYDERNPSEAIKQCHDNIMAAEVQDKSKLLKAFAEVEKAIYGENPESQAVYIGKGRAMIVTGGMAVGSKPPTSLYSSMEAIQDYWPC